jgi:hypothetical protein
MVTESVRAHMGFLEGFNSFQGGKRLFTMTPSEPMLSLAACQALNDVTIHTYANATASLLKEVIYAGMIDCERKGPRAHGELYACLVLTIARDIATCRPLDLISAPDHNNQFVSWNRSEAKVKTITLAHFLTKLVGDGVLPENLLEDLRNTHINFTHFTPLEEEFYALSSSWLREAWDRGQALKCARRQHVIDLLIVTYSAPLEEPWDMTQLGTFCVAFKVQNQGARHYRLPRLVGPWVDGRRSDKEVDLLMDLSTDHFYNGTQSRISCEHAIPTRPWDDNADIEKPRWLIGVRGGGPDTYPFLKYFPEFCHALSLELHHYPAGFQESYEQMEKQYRGRSSFFTSDSP